MLSSVSSFGIAATQPRLLEAAARAADGLDDAMFLRFS